MSMALTTAHPDAHTQTQNTKQKETQSKWAKQTILTINQPFTKKRRASGATQTFIQFERMTSGARCSYYEEIIAVNT